MLMTSIKISRITGASIKSASIPSALLQTAPIQCASTERRRDRAVGAGSNEANRISQCLPPSHVACDRAPIAV